MKRMLTLGKFFLHRLAIGLERLHGSERLPRMVVTCFPKLPPETVSNIFDQIDFIGDCFCLALTSKRCWLIGQPRMKTIILDLAIQWAGDRIICIGDYLRRGDLPPNLLSKEEEEELDRDYDGDPQGDYDQESQLTAYERLIVRCNIGVSSTAYWPYDLLYKLVHWQKCKNVPPQYQLKLMTDIKIGYRAAEILRNISKRQYVRRSALLEMFETGPERWRLHQIDLGHVVLSRISWSSDPSVAMTYEGDIHRGVWAGDRLDITSEDALDEKDENGQLVEWTDVTDEVLKEMYEIWLSEYGLGERG